MFIYKSISSIKRAPGVVTPSLSLRVFSHFPSEEKNNNTDLERDKAEGKRLLRKWRKEEPQEKDAFASLLDFSETIEESMYRKKFPLKPSEFTEWFDTKKIEYNKWSQRYIAERHATLGKDLAITHYVLHRGGKIRRKGHSNYLGPDDMINLPNSYDPTWLVEEIDASGIELYYEALDNFKDLERLKIARFCNNQNFDDWCLERILAICPNIQHLDVSNCVNVTERGLEGIYRNWNLKTLVITDFNCTAAFELTVLLLEDVRPDLKVIVNRPQEEQINNNPSQEEKK